MFSWTIDDFDDNGKLVLLYRHQRIIDENIVKKGDRVLDIGGWGKLEYRLYQEECNVCSIDIDKQQCSSLRIKYGISFSIINGNACALPFKDESFDTVACFEVFEHLIPERRPQIIKEISRVLKNRNQESFVGTIPIPGRCHPKDDPTVSFLTPEEFNMLISDHFNNIIIEPTGSITKGDTPVSWYFKAAKIDNTIKSDIRKEE